MLPVDSEFFDRMRSPALSASDKMRPARQTLDMPTEPELMAVRLARMKSLVDVLERECLKSVDQRDNFLKLKRELDAARDALRIIDTSRS